MDRQKQRPPYCSRRTRLAAPLDLERSSSIWPSTKERQLSRWCSPSKVNEPHKLSNTADKQLVNSHPTLGASEHPYREMRYRQSNKLRRKRHAGKRKRLQNLVHQYHIEQIQLVFLRVIYHLLRAERMEQMGEIRHHLQLQGLDRNQVFLHDYLPERIRILHHHHLLHTQLNRTHIRECLTKVL